jgi:hypothetical protein
MVSVTDNAATRRGKRARGGALEMAVGLLAMLSFVALLGLRHVWDIDMHAWLSGAGIALGAFVCVVLHAGSRTAK